MSSILFRGCNSVTWTPRAERMPCLEVAILAISLGLTGGIFVETLLSTCEAHQELLQQLGSDSWVQSEDVSELDKA